MDYKQTIAKIFPFALTGYLINIIYILYFIDLSNWELLSYIHIFLNLVFGVLISLEILLVQPIKSNLVKTIIVIIAEIFFLGTIILATMDLNNGPTTYIGECELSIRYNRSKIYFDQDNERKHLRLKKNIANDLKGEKQENGLYNCNTEVEIQYLLNTKQILSIE